MTRKPMRSLLCRLLGHRDRHTLYGWIVEHGTSNQKVKRTAGLALVRAQPRGPFGPGR